MPLGPPLCCPVPVGPPPRVVVGVTPGPPRVLEHPELLQAGGEKTAPVGGEGFFLLIYHFISKTNAAGLGARLDVSPAPGHEESLGQGEMTPKRLRMTTSPDSFESLILKKKKKRSDSGSGTWLFGGDRAAAWG